MSENTNQVNYGWGVTLDMTHKVPAINKRIFNTYQDALAFANDLSDSAIGGLLLTVIADGDNNGAYFVKKAKMTSSDNAELVKLTQDSDNINAERTKLSSSITIEGGPLASDAVKDAFDGIIPAGTDIQEILKALLCVEIYPNPSTNSPTYGVSISSPSVSITNSSVITTSGNDKLVEVGQQITFGSVTANAVTITKTEPKVSGFSVGDVVYGYSDSIDGTITKSNAVSGAWDVTKINNEVYKLSAEIVSGFTDGSVPTEVTAATNSDCVLTGCTLTAVLGTNTYKVTEDAPKHTGSHNGVPSKYIVSNLGGRSESKKSPSISATTTNVDKDPENKATSLTVIGVYPIFTNGVTASTTDATAAAMADLANPVADYGTKLPLMKASTSFAISFAHQDLQGYSLCLPGSWKISTAKAIDPLTKTFADDCKSKFVENGTVTKKIQGKDVTYKVYTYSQSAGPNRVKFTVA